MSLNNNNQKTEIASKIWINYYGQTGVFNNTAINSSFNVSEALFLYNKMIIIILPEQLQKIIINYNKCFQNFFIRELYFFIFEIII